MYDENTLVEKMLPTLYAEDYKFYDGKSKKLVSNFMSILKMLIYLTLLYNIFNVLPEQQLNPHRAFQKLLKGKVKKVPLADLYEHTSSVMYITITTWDTFYFPR